MPILSSGTCTASVAKAYSSWQQQERLSLDSKAAASEGDPFHFGDLDDAPREGVGKDLFHGSVLVNGEC